MDKPVTESFADPRNSRRDRLDRDQRGERYLSSRERDERPPPVLSRGGHYNQRPRISMDYDDLERSQPSGSSFVDRRNLRRMGASDGGPSSELEYSHEYEDRHMYRSRDNRYRSHDDSSRSDPRYPTNSASYGYDERMYSNRDQDRYSARNIYPNDRDRDRSWPRRERRPSRERHYERENERERLSRDYSQHRNNNVPPPYFDRDGQHDPTNSRDFPFRRRPYFREGELELDRINPPRFSVQIPTNIRREYNNRSTSPTRSSITSSSSSLSKHQSISPKLKSLSGNSEEISPHHVEQEINQNSQNSSIQHSDRIEENENFNYPKEQKREKNKEILDPSSLSPIDTITTSQNEGEERKTNENEGEERRTSENENEGDEQRINENEGEERRTNGNENEKGGWSGWRSIDQGEPDLVEGDISLQGEGEGEANVTEVNDDNELPESKIDLIAVETTPPSKLDETDLISVKLNEPKSKDELSPTIDYNTNSNLNTIESHQEHSINDMEISSMPTNEDIKNLNEDLTINTPNTSPKELELPIVSCNSNSQRTELINALGREIEQIEEDLDKWNHIYNKKKEKITKRVEKEREEREKCKKEKENLKEKCKEEQRVKRAAEDRALCVNQDENENKEIKVQIQKKRRKSKKKHVFRNNKRRALDQKSTKKIAEGISNINDTEESNIHSKRLEVKTNEEEIKKIYKDLFDGVGLVESRPALIKSFNLKKKEEDCKIEELKKQRENLRNKWNVSHKTNNNNEEKLKKDRYSRNQGTRKSGRFSKNDYVNSEAAVEEIAKQILKEAEQERRAAPVPPMIIGEKNRHYAKFINNNNIVRDPVSFYGFNKDPGEKWTPEEHVVFMRQFKFTPKRFEEIAKHLEQKNRNDCHNYYYYLKSKKIEIYKELKKAYSLNKNGSKVKEEFGKSTNNRNTVVKQSPKKRKAPLIATESDHQQRTDNNLPERRNNMRENSVGNNCVEIYNKEDDLTENDQNQLVTEEIINKIEIEEQADDDYSLKSQSTSIPLISSIATMDPPLPTNNQNFQQNITDVEDAAHALTLLAQLPITENTQKSMQKGGKNKSKQYDHPTRARNLSIEENVPTKKKITSSYWNKSDVEKFNNSLNQYGTNFKKISEILETKSETQVKNYYEKHIASGVIPKTVESRSETLAHLETSPSISTTHTPQPVVQTSSDINTEQQTFNNNGNYFNNNRSDTQPQVEPPHKSVTSPSINYNRSSSPQSSVKSAISHLLNPSTDDNISHDWFNGDQSSDNPMVIDVDAEESRPPEIMSSVVNQPTPIQFIPVTQSTQPNQSLNRSQIIMIPHQQQHQHQHQHQQQQQIQQTHQQQQQMQQSHHQQQIQLHIQQQQQQQQQQLLHQQQQRVRNQESHIPKYFMPTISNSQQSQNIPQHRQGWVEQNQFRQSNSLPQAYYSSNTPPPPPPHHSVQPQGPNNMAPNNINTNSLAPSNLSPNSMSPTTPASMYLPPTNPIYPYQYSSLIVPDSSSQNRSSGQLVTGSNTVNQHSPGRGTYPTTSTYLPRGGAPVFENYNNVSPNVPSIITSPTPPPLDNVQIRQSNYVVPQHQVDRNRNSGPPP